MDLHPPQPPLADPDGRFVLRPWRLPDAPALVAAWLDPEIARWCRVPADRSPAHAAEWITGWSRRVGAGSLDLVVAHAALDTPLGEVGLRRLVAPPGERRRPVLELGWWVAADHRGMGLGRRAVALLACWARHETGSQLVARVSPGLVASEHIAASVGLVARGPLASGHTLWATAAAGCDDRPDSEDLRP